MHTLEARGGFSPTHTLVLSILLLSGYATAGALASLDPLLRQQGEALVRSDKMGITHCQLRVCVGWGL